MNIFGEWKKSFNATNDNGKFDGKTYIATNDELIGMLKNKGFSSSQ